MKKIILFCLTTIVINSIIAQIINIPTDYPTIQEGIDAATLGDTVLVQPGTFLENITIDTSITLASTFLFTGDNADISNTIIDGGANGPAVSFIDNGSLSSNLIGFTIKNGYKGVDCDRSTLELKNLIVEYNQFAGIHCSNSNLNLKNVTINGGWLWCDESNANIEYLTLINSHGLYSGFIQQSNVNIVHSGIANNSAIWGGGLYFIDSEGLIDHVTVSENEAINGGGIYFSGSNFLIRNSKFAGNKSDSIYNNPSGTGGAIFCDFSQLTIQNTLFNGNAVNYTGNGVDLHSVLYCENNSNAKLMNSTITGNEQHDGWIWSPDVLLIGCSYDWHGDDSSKVELINTLVYFNDSLPTSIFSPEVTASYSNIQREYDVFDGEGNINEDPLFVGSGQHSYQINDYSPCIDAGLPDTTGLYLPEFDLAEEYRFSGENVDIGAYEWNLFVGTEEAPIEVAEVTGIKLFPNPANSKVILSGKFSSAETIDIRIYNTEGLCLKNWKFTSEPNIQQEINLNLHDLPAGIYFLRIDIGNDMLSRKVVKL